MKSKKIFILLFYYVGVMPLLCAQVGIKTYSPLGVLHLDCLGDTDNDTKSNTNDDIVILDNARLGVGTISPSANLELQGGLKIMDGTQGDSKILLCDDNGLSRWSTRSLEITRGKIGDSLAEVFSNTWSLTGASIVLPKGSWIVYFQANYKASAQRGGNIWWDLSTSNMSRNMNGGRCLSNYAYQNTICSTYAVYYVSLTSTATYYIWGNAMNLSVGESMSYIGNGQIYAIQIN